MRTRYWSSAVVTTMALLAVLTSTASAQATRTCDGKEATIVGTPGDDDLRGTGGDDVIVSLEGNDRIFGFEGNDTICAGKGNDLVYGGGGFDIIFGAEGNDKLFSTSGGIDVLRQDTRGARMFGGAGDDILQGSDRWDRMQGGPGDDEIHGYAGRDWIRGGTGNDVIDGGKGIDDVRAGGGADTIYVTNGDSARGGVGFDRCVSPLPGTGKQFSCVDRRPPPPLAAGEFEWVTLDGEATTGKILGIAPGSLAPGAAAAGRCFYVLTEITLSRNDFYLTAEQRSAPSFGAEGARSANGRCDLSAPIAKGWFFGRTNRMTPQSTFATFTPVFVPDGTADPDVALLWTRDEPLRFETTMLSEIPDPPERVARDPLGKNQTWLDDASFTHVGVLEEWSGQIESISLVNNLSMEHAGLCFAIQGQITAASALGATVAVDPPTVSGFSNGLWAPGADFCDRSAAIAGGYFWLGRMEVPVGQTRRFHSTVFVPDPLAFDVNDITHIVIGGPAILTSSTVIALS